MAQRHEKKLITELTVDVGRCWCCDGAHCSDKRGQVVLYAGQECPRCSGLILLLESFNNWRGAGM